MGRLTPSEWDVWELDVWGHATRGPECDCGQYSHHCEGWQVNDRSKIDRVAFHDEACDTAVIKELIKARCLTGTPADWILDSHEDFIGVERAEDGCPTLQLTRVEL